MIGPAALLAAALLQGGGHPGMSAPAGETAVSIGFGDYAPAHVVVLEGDTVRWTNDSVRPHTVTAADGAWDSGRMPIGVGFARRFDAAGAVPYVCTLHPFMRGEVDVQALLLDAPAHPAGPGRPYPLTGRAALPAGTPVTIEADAGDGFTPAAQATVAPDGSFAATVRPATSATYRARAGVVAGPPVTLLVLDRAVTAHVRGGVVSATVTPASPGARVVLQLRLRERFGWWPVRRARLDARSRATFAPVRVRRRAVPARVVLTLPDGATPLAVSAPVRVG